MSDSEREQHQEAPKMSDSERERQRLQQEAVAALQNRQSNSREIDVELDDEPEDRSYYVDFFDDETLASVKGFVDNLIKSKPVVIFSKSYCPFCTKVKNAIGTFKLAPNAMAIVELDQRDDCDPMQDYLLQITGVRWVPYVFVGGNFLGGGDDTVAAQQKGILEEKLKAANALA